MQKYAPLPAGTPSQEIDDGEATEQPAAAARWCGPPNCTLARPVMPVPQRWKGCPAGPEIVGDVKRCVEDYLAGRRYPLDLFSKEFA